MADTGYDGTISWKEYIATLTPEQLEILRKRDRARAKKWYQENKERKKLYDAERKDQNTINRLAKKLEKQTLLYDEDL